MPTPDLIGSHEVQAVITVTLLLATSLLALMCDYMRFRMQRGLAPAAKPLPAAPKMAIAPTLVPEIEVPAQAAASHTAPKSTRASRLAAALKQPRRVVSPEVQAIIERSSQFDVSAPAVPKTADNSAKKSKLLRAG